MKSTSDLGAELMTIPFEYIINPRSVAIIGASDDMAKFGGRIIGYLLMHKYKGKIYPINRKRETVRGLRCYSSVTEIPEPPDVAVMAIPPLAVVEAIKGCAERKVGCAIIITTGFAEMSENGKQLQDQIIEIAKPAGMRIWGPNCMGLVNPVAGVALSSTYTQDIQELIPGSIGMVSQSGGLFAAMFNRANDEKIGLRAVCSTGNEADIDTSEILAYYLNDKKTRVLAAYNEGLRNPKRFLEIAKKALIAGKPIVIFKVGSSEQGQRAALSHTASLAGSDQSFNDLCRQYGVIRVHELETLLPTANLFARYGVPAGSKLAVIGASGGHAGIIPDRAEFLGLKLSKLSPKTRAFLHEIIGPTQSINPADLAVGDMKLYRQCVETIGADPEVEAILYAFGTTPAWEKRMGNLIDYAKNAPVPVFFYTLVGSKAGDIPEKAREAGIPFFWNLDQCLTAIRDWFRYGELRQKRLREKEKLSERPEDTAHCSVEIELPQNGRFTEVEAKNILDRLNIRTPDRRIVRSAADAKSAANKIGFPVVLKALSPDLVHKTEMGGVRLDLRDEDAVSQAYHEIMIAFHNSHPSTLLDGVLVEQMISGGLEVILGARQEPQFGAQILLGVGGIYTEILNKKATRFAPLSRMNVDEMLQESQLSQLLAGKRNNEPLDAEALTEAVLRISALMVRPGIHIQELDINPLIVLPRGKGVCAADAFISLSEAI
jgi:acyl-CoA synthetase (NDP forming)